MDIFLTEDNMNSYSIVDSQGIEHDRDNEFFVFQKKNNTLHSSKE